MRIESTIDMLKYQIKIATFLIAYELMGCPTSLDSPVLKPKERSSYLRIAFQYVAMLDFAKVKCVLRYYILNVFVVNL